MLKKSSYMHGLFYLKIQHENSLNQLIPLKSSWWSEVSITDNGIWRAERFYITLFNFLQCEIIDIPVNRIFRIKSIYCGP